MSKIWVSFSRNAYALCKSREHFEEQFKHLLFFRFQVFGPLSQCPQRALQPSVLLFVENALEFFHLFLAEIVEGGTIELSHVETITDYFRVWQDFHRRIDEAFVYGGR